MLCTELDTKGLYQKAVPYTHPACPDNRIHRKERCDPGYVSAGLSALSEMSMLNPPAVETWGMVGGKN